MRVLQIATVGENVDAVLMGVREFPVVEMHLLYMPDFEGEARDLARRLRAIKLETKIHAIGMEGLIETMRTVATITADRQKYYDEVMINVSGGPRMMSCALLSAAFVNGITSFDCMDDQPVSLPVLKFSYAELLSSAKLRILQALGDLEGGASSLAELAAAVEGDSSLLSYHIRGGRDGKGLEELGMVEVQREVQGKLSIDLTPIGKLMLVGRGSSAP